MMQRVWQDIQLARYAEAETVCRDLLTQEPSNSEAELALGLIAYYRRDPKRAMHHVAKVLTAVPDAFPALNLGARALLDLGEPERALQLSRQALAQQPADPLVIQHTGRCLMALGKPVEALKLFDEVIRLTPDQPGGYFDRAAAMLDIGSAADVIEALNEGLKLTHDLPRLAKLAELESAIGRPALALSAAQRVLQEDPTHASANMTAARSMTELGWLDEAERFWQAAKTTMREPWRVDRQHGYVLSMTGHFKEAEAHLRNAIAQEPNQGLGYQLLFNVRKANESDKDLVRQMIELAANQELEQGELASLEFAIAKAWDDLNDPARAMAHYEKANAIRAQEIEAIRPFRQKEFAEECKHRRERFVLHFPERTGPATDQPIFVLGMMRSGTSLVEQILTAHPMVTGAGELDFWPGAERLFTESEGGRLTPELVQERRAAYLRLLASLGGGETPRGTNRRVVDKNPANIMTAGLIHHVFPDAPIIHMHRRPVDVALSMWMTDGSAPFLAKKEDIVFAIGESNLQAQHLRTILPKNRFLDVSYEALVQAPEPTIRGILEFCGLPWNEACMHAQRVRSSVKTASLWQVRQPIYQSSVDRWKRYEPWLGEFKQLL